MFVHGLDFEGVYLHDEKIYVFYIRSFILNFWSMFNMATIRLASNLKIDANGYANGLLTVGETIQTVQNSNGDKRSLIVDTHEKECIELVFACENTRNEPFNIKTLIFGLTVNPEPTGKIREGTKSITTYNKLTTTLIRLDILNKELLDKARKDIAVLDVDTIMAQLYAIKDLPVRFKPQKNKNNFWEPNLLTLEILPDEVV